MNRIALIALLSVAAFAQKDAPAPAEKPPADVDQELRGRITEFYTLIKTGQYRKAENVIAEDTKDYYYAGTKSVVHDFEIVSVEYSDHFTHAKAVVRCKEPLSMAGFPPSEINVNIPTLWRIEDGKWVVYEDMNKILNPSGLATKIQEAVTQVSPTAPGVPREMPKNPAFVLGKVQADRLEIKIAPGTAEEIKIVNSASGPFTLELQYPLPGIEAKLDHSDLPPGKVAILTLTAGSEPKGGFYDVRIMPTGEVIRIKVEVK